MEMEEGESKMMLIVVLVVQVWKRRQIGRMGVVVPVVKKKKRLEDGNGK